MPRRQPFQVVGFQTTLHASGLNSPSPSKERTPMLKGFKEFISQGNALELAVAVIIGAAFKPIVDAITKVILDIIGQVVGQPNFDSVG